MSKFPRLPYSVNRVIEEQWLKCDPPAFIMDPDPSISPILDQSKVISPFKCHFNGTVISDGFYSIPATSPICLPNDSNILITDWSLKLGSHLSIEILQAELLTDQTSSHKSPLLSIESNPLVASTLRKFKFHLIQDNLESDSVCSQDTKEFLMGIKDRNEEINKNIEKIGEEAEINVDEGIVEGIEEPVIGFGQKSVKKARDFQQRRERRDEDGDVLMMAIGSDSKKRIESEDEKKLAKAMISLSYDIGVDVFPHYALEYLKHKYKIV